MSSDGNDIMRRSNPEVRCAGRDHRSHATPWDAQDLSLPPIEQGPRLLRRKSSFFNRRKPKTEEKESFTPSDEFAPPVPTMPARYRLPTGTQSTSLADLTVTPPVPWDRHDEFRPVPTSSSLRCETPPLTTLHDESRIVETLHPETIITPVVQYSMGSTCPRDIDPFLPLVIGRNKSSSTMPYGELALSDHEIEHRQTMDEFSRDTPRVLTVKGRSSGYQHKPFFSSSSSRGPAIFTPEPTVTVSSHQNPGLSRPSSPRSSFDVSPPLPKEPTPWIEANASSRTPSYPDFSYCSPEPVECPVPRRDTSTAVSPSTSQNTSCPERVASLAKSNTASSQYFQPSNLRQEAKRTELDDRDKIEVHRQEINDPTQDAVIYPKFHCDTLQQSESPEAQLSRAPSPSPSADSEAAERWLTQGTELRLLSFPQAQLKYSQIPAPYPTCKKQLNLRLCPQASTSPHPGTDTPASAGSTDTTQQYPPRDDRIPSFRSTSSSRGRERSLPENSGKISSGQSSRGRASGGILRAKRSLKNLFQRRSSEADAQNVSRPVLVPQPRPDNDVPPMPTRMAFDRPDGSPPRRPKRCETDVALLDLDSLGLTRIGFTGLVRNDENGSRETVGKRSESVPRRRTSRYVVEQSGEVQLPPKRGAALSSTRRGMLIRDVVTGALEFVADI